MADTAAAPTVEDIQADQRSAGSSSTSPSSSTSTGGRARSSSLPHISTTSSPTARVRRLRRGRDRPGPERPGHRGDPRPRELHAGPVAAEPRALRLRHHRRGRGVAVLPAHDPPPPARRPARRARLRVQARPRARVLPRPAERRRLDRGRRRARHAREALLRHGRADTSLRLPDDGLEVLQRARLGQLRERPRGRERPVRAELRVRRRARQLRPGDLLPLHGPHARRAARDDRDVHAEAVHAT